jgi:formamidopyrimidine-DNA glycosylase
MPELPEVQTTVNGINMVARGLTIQEIWTDLAKKTVLRPNYKESIKYLPFFEAMQKTVRGKKIISAERRAKNILINLSGGHTILIHMKMTGHLMYGTYIKQKNQSLKLKAEYWEPSPEEKNDALRDPYNRFIHFVISFTNGKQLVLSDVRKFAKVTLISTKEAHQTKHLDALGPEPLEKSFGIKDFISRINKKKSGKIKSVLMDQSVISGVGNIYSDEALWLAGIHPNSIVSKIPEKNIKGLFPAIQAVLNKGIDFGGDSTSDYRQIDGTRGKFSHQHNAYRLTGGKCKKPKCSGTIKRLIVGGRSAHFCETHQKLYS